MNLSTVLNEMQMLKHETDIIVASLKEISDLDRDRARNVLQIRSRLDKLKKAQEKLETTHRAHRELSDWLADYANQLSVTQEKAKIEFGVNLQPLLAGQGIQLSGQYPKLQGGLFFIILDLDKWRAAISYGQTMEPLGRCNLFPQDVANFIHELQQHLGSGLSETELLRKIYAAYRVLSTERNEEQIPIMRVFDQLQSSFKTSNIGRVVRDSNRHIYERADFSYDLYRLSISKAQSIENKVIVLVTATRAFTRRRQDFIWIPSDQGGKGTTFSHLQFKENHP